MTEKVNLENYRRGQALAEFNEALDLLWDNVVDPNVEATKKRKVVLTMEVVPDKSRRNATVIHTIKSTLAEPEAVAAIIYVSLDGAAYEHNPDQLDIEATAQARQLASVDQLVPDDEPDVVDM